MRFYPEILASVAICSLLSGCVAALLPLAAAGALGKTQIDRAKAKREFVAAGAVELSAGSIQQFSAGGDGTLKQQDKFSGQGGGVEPDEESRQYLSRFFKPVSPVENLPYTDFARYALVQSERLEAGEGVESVVLKPRAMLEKQPRVSCAGKPLAVLIDLDEADAADEGWLNADTLYLQNGLVGALRQLRANKISVIWLSNEAAAMSERIAAVLREADLAETGGDDFLFLDRGGDDRKQARRWDAARNYCIVAIAGDKRSDFDELYDYLRDPDGAIQLEHMFGAGWFLAPPPLIAAGLDESGDITLAEKEVE